MTRSIITVLQPWQRRRYDLKKDEFLIEFSKIIKVPVDQITENEALRSDILISISSINFDADLKSLKTGIRITIFINLLSLSV